MLGRGPCQSSSSFHKGPTEYSRNQALLKKNIFLSNGHFLGGDYGTIYWGRTRGKERHKCSTVLLHLFFQDLKLRPNILSLFFFNSVFLF